MQDPQCHKAAVLGGCDGPDLAKREFNAIKALQCQTSRTKVLRVRVALLYIQSIITAIFPENLICRFIERMKAVVGVAECPLT